LKISLIELYHVSVPLPATFWPTWIPGYPQTHNRFTLIRLRTDTGIEGWSAGSAMGKERQGLGDLLGGYLMGADPTDIQRVQDLLKQAGFLGWRNFWIEGSNPPAGTSRPRQRENRSMNCSGAGRGRYRFTAVRARCVRLSSGFNRFGKCVSEALNAPNSGSRAGP